MNTVGGGDWGYTWAGWRWGVFSMGEDILKVMCDFTCETCLPYLIPLGKSFPKYGKYILKILINQTW